MVLFLDTRSNVTPKYGTNFVSIRLHYKFNDPEMDTIPTLLRSTNNTTPAYDVITSVCVMYVRVLIILVGIPSECSAHFSGLPTLYTPHSFCILHPFHIIQTNGYNFKNIYAGNKNPQGYES